MTQFFLKLKEKFSNQVLTDGPLEISGLSPSRWCFIADNFLSETLFSSSHLIVCATFEDAEEMGERLKNVNPLLYLGHDYDLYSSVLSSEYQLYSRLNILTHLTNNISSQIIITHQEAVQLLIPPKEFFLEHSFKIKKDDIISPRDLAQKLVHLGYQSSQTVEEPGTFSMRGSIFDIYPLGEKAYRINYFDDLIETIFEIDLSTQRTNKQLEQAEIIFYPSPSHVCQDKYLINLRKNLPQPQPRFKKRFEHRKLILNRLSEGLLPENYPVLFPLFFNNPQTIIDYLPRGSRITFLNPTQGKENYKSYYDQLLQSFNEQDQHFENENIIPSPDKIYQANPDLSSFLISYIEEVFDGENSYPFKTIPLKPMLQEIMIKNNQTSENILSALHNIWDESKHLFIAYVHEGSLEEITKMLKNKNADLSQYQLKPIKTKLDQGFYFEDENLYFLSESDFFTSKKSKIKKVKQTDPDLFAEQISTLKNGDYVVHRDFGVGIYRGIISLSFGNQTSDYLQINFENDDKVYVPVYRLNIIQKLADSESDVRVSSLKSKKFNEAKTRAQQAVKKLAFDLLKIQAERKLKGGFAFSMPDNEFHLFEQEFPFEETPDQEKAIFDVIDNMTKPTPMDRLVCGDVGFGKTEVAMRAAFKAVLDKKQVVVLVPTTILALQHYHSFLKRFSKFPVNIDFVSRFKSPKEKKITLENVSAGKVDILVGTHAVLSDKISFHDLGLLIIDEEHRFGVGHKEKLKALKNQVDVLTMTATPIPRTLQLAFLGIRDLSLIQTAPPSRQAIKTYLVKKDLLTIKSAMEKELSRGGQIYYVHNRVNDIEEVASKLKELVPKAKIVITHGQMNESELEKRINDFYQHKADILLTTTIIESGIDIPNANTMIIDRADRFGLAQLHQLRGRIGRSDRKAYAYFVIPENKELGELANRRLHALKTYVDIGSGFSLASSDMEIRGSGDILGPDQSGHIETIGLELYMDLLQEAILELKGQTQYSLKNVEVQTSFDAYLPNKYIPESAVRLKLYKRLSNARTHEMINSIKEEMTELYGLLPQEAQTLLNVLNARLYFQKAGIKTVKVSSKTILLFFDEEYMSTNPQIRDKLIQYFLSRPKHYKIQPNQSVECFSKETVSHEYLLDFAKHIAEQI